MDSSKTYTPELAEILEILDIPFDGTIKGLHEVTQKAFLTNYNLAHYNYPKLDFESKREKLLPIFNDLGWVGAVYPNKEKYDVVLIYGALVNTMRKRIRFLDELWQKGIRAKRVVFLLGERPLYPENENRDVLTHVEKSSASFRVSWVCPDRLPEDEAQAALFLWDQIVQNDELRDFSVEYYSLPIYSSSETSELKRPTTYDTLHAWLSENSNAGDVLAISNNPYVNYQHTIGESVLSQELLEQENLTLETVGCVAAEDTPLGIYLDKLARCLHAEVKAHSLL